MNKYPKPKWWIKYINRDEYNKQKQLYDLEQEEIQKETEFYKKLVQTDGAKEKTNPKYPMPPKRLWWTNRNEYHRQVALHKGRTHVTVTRYGGLRVDPETLANSHAFKKQVAAMKKLFDSMPPDKRPKPYGFDPNTGRFND